MVKFFEELETKVFTYFGTKPVSMMVKTPIRQEDLKPWLLEFLTEKGILELAEDLNYKYEDCFNHEVKIQMISKEDCDEFYLYVDGVPVCYFQDGYSKEEIDFIIKDFRKKHGIQKRK